MLYKMSRLLQCARENKFAIGYFESFNMDGLLAVIAAAEEAQAPVIVGFGGQFVNSPKNPWRETIYPYGAVALDVAKRAKVPAAVILNEANHEEMVYQGMNAGFNAVMYQKKGEAFEDTVRITREICRVAHMLDIEVESEVGELPCANIASGTQSEGKDTDLSQAEYFVRETGVDALAIAIGNVHLLETDKVPLDYGLLRQIRDAVPVPLVLHGGTGLSPDVLKEAIREGVTKINVGTVFKRAYIDTVDKFVKSRDLSKINPHITIGWGGEEDMIACGRRAVKDKVLEFIDIFGCAGKAALF